MPANTEERVHRTFFGHPRGLANLFGVEMWERFSFYGMQAILIFYLYYSADKGGLGLSEATATSIVGAYGGLVYLCTIVGAWLADRLAGSERVLFYSAVLIMFGHISLAILPGFTGVGVGLGAIALGSGGLKANATSLVGSLYSQDDPRRDGGFTIFYLGVNIGALFGPLLTGFAQESLGFHYGFGLAAVGMAVGLTQYAFGRKNLGEHVNIVPNPLPNGRKPMIAGGTLAAIAAVVLLVLTGVITASALSDVVVVITLAATVAYFAVILTSKRITSVERKRVFAFIPMFVASFAFFSLFQQQFTVLPIYFAERVDRTMFGLEVPEAWMNAINPVFIILLAGAFATMWTKLGNRQPPAPIKFALGTSVIGLAFLAYLPMAGSTGNTTPFIVLVGILFLFTVGELLLSPVGLSLSTKLAPEQFRTQMVSLNFLSVALGSAMAGSLAGYYSVDNEAAYFGTLGAVAIAIGVLLGIASPWILKLMRGVR